MNKLRAILTLLLIPLLLVDMLEICTRPIHNGDGKCCIEASADDDAAETLSDIEEQTEEEEESLLLHGLLVGHRIIRDLAADRGCCRILPLLQPYSPLALGWTIPLLI